MFKWRTIELSISSIYQSIVYHLSIIYLFIIYQSSIIFYLYPPQSIIYHLSITFFKSNLIFLSLLLLLLSLLLLLLLVVGVMLVWGGFKRQFCRICSLFSPLLRDSDIEPSSFVFTENALFSGSSYQLYIFIQVKAREKP